MAEVGSQVRAVGIEQCRLAGLGAEQHEVAAEVVQRLHIADLQCVGSFHGIPAIGDGFVVTGSHGLFSSSVATSSMLAFR